VDPASRLRKFSQDDARLINVPANLKSDIIRQLRACRKAFYPSYEAFRLHVREAASIKTLPADEAEVVALTLVQIARASAVWICASCEKVIGLIEAPLDQDPKAFVAYTLVVASQETLSCPSCSHRGYLFLKPSFLVSGMSLAALASQL
jgi:rubrerythrin